jgi:xylulokinase
MSEQLVISVDCSTTAAKAIVWDVSGRQLSEGRQEIPLSIPNEGWGEQDPKAWWTATSAAIAAAVKGVDATKIKALVLTHQRESFACLDENDEPLRPAMLWLDTRAHDQVKRFGTSRIHTLTGKPANPTPAFYKLLWIRDNEPAVFAKISRVADVHAYLSLQLTGMFATSTASADPLGVVDLESMDYSPEILRTLQLSDDVFPELCVPGTVIATLLPEVSKALGLPPELPLISGGGDGQCAGLGAGVAAPGTGYLNLGTGLIAGIYSDDYKPSFAYRAMSGTVPASYNYEFFVGAGTYLVNWFKTHISQPENNIGGAPEQYWESKALEVPIGSEGLFTLPYWNGALTPYWDQNARGSIVGFSGIHGNEHLYRSILEGIAFELRLCIETASATIRQPVERFITMGGGSKSALWCQILADNLRIPIAIARSQEATALGAAMLGFAALGVYESIPDASAQMSGFSQEFLPNPDNAARYDRYFEVYKSLYPALKSTFSAIQEL